MTKFTDNLWRDLVREHGPALALADRPEPGRARSPPASARSRGQHARAGGRRHGDRARPDLDASSTPASAAVTVAKVSDGSVLVTLNQPGSQALPQANQKLTAMGIHERVIDLHGVRAGSRQRPGDLHAGAGSIPSQPPVKVLVGTNGTEVIGPGTTPGNTGVGTWHLHSCNLASDNGRHRATRAPGDLVRIAGARPARASAMTRLAVRPPDGGGRTAAWWPWLLVAAAVGWNLVNLRALTLSVAYLNDSTLHEQMVRFATAQLRAGHLPLTSWFPFLGEGSPQFLHYQSLPAILTGLRSAC